MRKAALELREIIRLNTLNAEKNKCYFDLSDAEKKLAQNPIRKHE